MQLQGDELTASFDKIRSTLDAEIPSQTKSLVDNALNLEKVSQYCEDIYVNSKDSDKQHLLNETKGYTTQALASVAYQIHVLANTFLQLFDNQSMIIGDMSESMSHLEHEIKIYKEKIARREVGILTSNKCVTRTVKVKRPECEEKPVKYIRKPIDYSMLDDIGHGVKLTRQGNVNMDQLTKIGVSGRHNSYSSGSGGTLSAMPSQAKDLVAASATPPLQSKQNQLMNMNLGNGMGTIRSSNASSASASYYRAPVAPPSVPSEYLSRQELGIYSSKKELNQSANAGNDDSISATYGTGNPYRRPSQTSNSIILPSGNNITSMLNTSEYSDTLGRGTVNSYLQQLSNYPINMMMVPGGVAGAQQSINNSKASMGYASGKELGIIRTNLNNIDYASGGTMYRRPQLHPSIYDPGFVHQQLQQQQMPPPPPNMADSTASVYSGAGGSQHTLPPPPPHLFANMPVSGGMVGMGEHHLENQIFAGVDEDEDDENDHDIIPNWVPIDKCLEKVVTIFDYERTRDDELSFKENMFIYVIKKNDDHWYEGIMKNEHGNIIQGLYPYNYARCVKRYVVDCRTTQC